MSRGCRFCGQFGSKMLIKRWFESDSSQNLIPTQFNCLSLQYISYSHIYNQSFENDLNVLMFPPGGVDSWTSIKGEDETCMVSYD